MAKKVYPQHSNKQELSIVGAKIKKQIPKKTFIFPHPNAKFGAIKSVCINISMMALLHYSQKTSRQRHRKMKKKILRREYEERKHEKKFIFCHKTTKYFSYGDRSLCFLSTFIKIEKKFRDQIMRNKTKEI